MAAAALNTEIRGSQSVNGEKLGPYVDMKTLKAGSSCGVKKTTSEASRRQGWQNQLGFPCNTYKRSPVGRQLAGHPQEHLEPIGLKSRE